MYCSCSRPGMPTRSARMCWPEFSKKEAVKMEDENKQRTYEADAIGVPPLRMVLVHADNDRANRTRRPQLKRQPRTQAERERMELITRLIESLEKEQA